jgi:PAS domain S-box-containing protein
MERIDRLRRELPPTRIRRLSPQLGSILLILALLILLVVLLLSRHHDLEVFSVLLGIVLAALGVVVFLLTRFLAVASEEQRQTTKALDTREREFQSVFENALDAILILDDQGICREANPSAARLFGARREDLIGQAIERFYKRPDDFRSSWADFLARKHQQGDAELLREDQSASFVEFTAKADYLPGRHVMILRDITQRRIAELALLEREALAQSAWAEAEALRKATLALTQDLRMDYVMDALLRSLAELIPYTCARVLIPEGGPHVLALGEKLCPETTKKPPGYPLTLNADKSPILQRILADQNSVLILDTKQEKEWHTFKGHTHLRSWLSVPLVASNQYLGFLSIGHNDPNRFTQEHLRRAQLLAIPAAAAIQNARLYERAEIYGSELERRLIDLDATQKALALSEGDRRISEEKFQKVFRSSPVAFSITTVNEGRFLDVNTAFENRYGYSHSDLIGHTVHELGIWEDPADRTFLITQLRRGGPVRNVITRLRTKSGEVKLTNYSADKIQFDGQACILAVSEDVPQYDTRSSN